jgi:hypothetical protein
MFIRFKTGATWQVLGSDRYDAAVGSPPAGITFSEWALSLPVLVRGRSVKQHRTGGLDHSHLDLHRSACRARIARDAEVSIFQLCWRSRHIQQPEQMLLTIR